MRNTQRLNVSDIDFESIRENLKTYLQSQDALRDYDFEGSAITSIIDVLAYATHYNAVNANIGLNETFLDTAQFRGSVVGHARQLGYTPRSSVAPVAYLDVVVNDPSSQSLTIPRGHRFKTTIDNTTYEFVTDQEYDTTDATFTNVKILQGRVRTAEFVYDVASNEKYTIPDVDVDTDTLRVEVYDSVNSSTFRVFTEATKLTSVTEESEIYFLSENPDGLFEITFGDDVIGRALENGNLIRIEYVVTNKTAANGASIFTSIDSVQGNSNLSITTAQVARGGDEREDLDSIRYNAPLSRAVTPQDFEAVIRENFANVDSVKAWGGEDNDPPVYGKVFISVKPQNSEILSDAEKTQILETIVRPKSVVTVTPEIIDPSFTYISLDVFFKYDTTQTAMTQTQLQTAVQNAILTYDENNLNRFNRVFRHSELLSVIDDTSDAVLNSTARVYVKKRFEPTLNRARKYEIDFSADLYNSRSKENIITTTSLFTYDGRSCRLKDRLTTDGNRIVQIVSGEGVNEITVVSNIGRIEGSKIVLENFSPSGFQGSFIEIEAIPDSLDIAPRRNNILVIDENDVSVVGEVDTIVAGQDFSGVTYSTTPRHA
jgi:hypothetical protein